MMKSKWIRKNTKKLMALFLAFTLCTPQEITALAEILPFYSQEDGVEQTQELSTDYEVPSVTSEELLDVPLEYLVTEDDGATTTASNTENVSETLRLNIAEGSEDFLSFSNGSNSLLVEADTVVSISVDESDKFVNNVYWTIPDLSIGGIAEEERLYLERTAEDTFVLNVYKGMENHDAFFYAEVSDNNRYILPSDEYITILSDNPEATEGSTVSFQIKQDLIDSNLIRVPKFETDKGDVIIVIIII